MDEELVESADLEFVVAFVNEYAAEPRLRAGESDRPYPDLMHLGATAPAALQLIAPAGTTGVHRQLVGLADRLYGVFANAQAEPGEALEAVNALLRQSAATPHLSWSTGGSAADWRLVGATKAADRLIRTLQAACALALYQWLVGRGSLDRLGVCNAHRCADVYVDVTQATSRRYCSAACGNRAKVAAHRARVRSTAAAAR